VLQLIYVSQIEARAAHELDTTMCDILRTSRCNNSRDAITGMLLADGFAFIQLLEGEADDVERCFARIQADIRHQSVEVRTRQQSESRVCEHWSMCGLTLSELDDALLEPGDIGFSYWQAPGDALFQTLSGLAARYGAMLDALHASGSEGPVVVPTRRRRS
jgi:hypothetical protein